MNILKTLVIGGIFLLFTNASFSNDENTGTGIVTETMTSGGYVYLRLENNDTWIASAPIAVNIGDSVTYSGGMMMKDFTSRTLKRTFEYIVFVTRVEITTKANTEAHASAVTSDPHAKARTTAAVAPQVGEITPLEGGKTIADIHAGPEQLKDQQVALRARVMKVSKEVMGKNWITLQDGTGTAPNNKLIATSLELVEVGDLVTVKGVVHTNVDLGSGYNYPVLIEEATFTR